MAGCTTAVDWNSGVSCMHLLVCDRLRVGLRVSDGGLVQP